MSAVQRNAFKRKSNETNAYPFDSTKTFKAGQAAIWDDTAKQVTVGLGANGGATSTDGRNFIGTFQDAWPMQSTPFGTTIPAPPFLTVRENGVQVFFGKSGATFKPMDDIVIDDTAGNQDGQHVRVFDAGAGDSSSDIIGKVASDYPAAGFTIAADLVEVRVRLKRPLLVNFS